MNKQIFYIRIGELYLNDITVDSDNIQTYFIKGLELNANFPKAIGSNNLTKILDLLEKLGITKDFITIETIQLDEFDEFDDYE